MSRGALKKRTFNYKLEIVDRPQIGRFSEKRGAYDDIMDKLITLESHKALMLDFKEFVGKAESMSSALYAAARRKKISIGVLKSDEHVTVWRKVQV